MAASNYALPPPADLEIHSEHTGEKCSKRAWDNYTLATGLNKAENVQVATLLTIIGEKAREVYTTFMGWEREGDHQKIVPVLQKFQ